MLCPFRCLKCAWASGKAPLRIAKVSVGQPASKELGDLKDWFPRSSDGRATRSKSSWTLSGDQSLARTSVPTPCQILERRSDTRASSVSIKATMNPTTGDPDGTAASAANAPTVSVAGSDPPCVRRST